MLIIDEVMVKCCRLEKEVDKFGITFLYIGGFFHLYDNHSSILNIERVPPQFQKQMLSTSHQCVKLKYYAEEEKIDAIIKDYQENAKKSSTNDNMIREFSFRDCFLRHRYFNGFRIITLYKFDYNEKFPVEEKVVSKGKYGLYLLAKREYSGEDVSEELRKRKKEKALVRRTKAENALKGEEREKFIEEMKDDENLKEVKEVSTKDKIERSGGETLYFDDEDNESEK